MLFLHYRDVNCHFHLVWRLLHKGYNPKSVLRSGGLLWLLHYWSLFYPSELFPKRMVCFMYQDFKKEVVKTSKLCSRPSFLKPVVWAGPCGILL